MNNRIAKKKNAFFAIVIINNNNNTQQHERKEKIFILYVYDDEQTSVRAHHYLYIYVMSRTYLAKNTIELDTHPSAPPLAASPATVSVLSFVAQPPIFLFCLFYYFILI